MLAILDRYITKTIIVATAMTALIIVGVLMLMTLLMEMKSIGTGDYSITQAIFFVLMRLPNELYQFSPMLMLLGSIIGLSILSSHRELAMMRASGFSTWRIMTSVLYAALLLILATTLLGECIGPTLSNHAEMRKEYMQNAGQAVITATGVWFHLGNNFIHVDHVVGRQLFEGVTRYEFDDRHQLQAAYFAKKLSFQEHQWRMYDVIKTSFYPERTKSESFPQAEWNLKFHPNLLNVGLVEPKELSLLKLAKFAHYLEKNGLQASEYQYQFWLRIIQPIASLVMIFLAIPFVLGTLSTTTMGWRIVAGIIVGFGFFILNALLGELCIVYQVPPLLAAVLPPLLFAIAGLFLAKGLIRT